MILTNMLGFSIGLSTLLSFALCDMAKSCVRSLLRKTLDVSFFSAAEGHLSRLRCYTFHRQLSGPTRPYKAREPPQPWRHARTRRPSSAKASAGASSSVRGSPRSFAAWFGLMCVALLFAVGGIVFTALTVLVSNAEMKATGKKITSEHFNTAGRNVGAGACSRSPSAARAPAAPCQR